MIEYILNLNPSSKRLHLRVDGMSRESCNLDQLKHFSVLTELPADGQYYRCFRCFPIGPAGEDSEGVAQ